jgi:hypothetical protein
LPRRIAPLDFEIPRSAPRVVRRIEAAPRGAKFALRSIA